MLALDGVWHRQAGVTAMGTAACSGDGLCSTHVLPRERRGTRKPRVMKQKSGEPLADGFLAVLPLWISSKAGCSQMETVTAPKYEAESALVPSDGKAAFRVL